MKRDSLVFALTGMFFGLLVGWIIGTQQGAGPVTPTAQAQAQTQAQAGQASTPAPASSAGQGPAVLDESRVRALTAAADERPRDAAVRVELGNLYFDAERFTDAIRWYQQALEIDPKNVNASTDLGVSYYYTNDADKALAQFRHSLSIDPRHTKTLLNVGIVRAFGKEDLAGAAQAWQQVIEIAPDSVEAARAKQAIDGMRAAHPEVGAAAAPATKGS